MVVRQPPRGTTGTAGGLPTPGRVISEEVFGDYPKGVDELGVTPMPRNVWYYIGIVIIALILIVILGF